MHRIVRTAGAISGVVALSALAAGPAVAAAPVSQATAQSLDVTIAGNPAVTQVVTATNDGSGQQKNDASTVPSLANLIPGNNALAVGVAPQNAGANSDGTSYACAGLAGTGGGIASVGNSSCNIKGAPLSLNLGSLNLDLTHLLGSGALTTPLNDALSSLTDPLTSALQSQVLDKLTSALSQTPLGQISLSGGLSAIESTCTANPTKAAGANSIVDTSGNHTIPISITLPGAGTKDLLDLDVNVPPKPGGTDVLVNLNTVTQSVIDAVRTELNKAVGGALSPLDQALGPVLQNVQDSVVNQLVAALKPALQALSDNLLKITVNDVTPSDGGRKVEATALKIDVLPAAKQFTGSSLLTGTIGHVTCGPNGKVAAPAPTQPAQPAPAPHHAKPAKLPLHVDSGLPGNSHGQGVGEAVLAAFATLFALTGTAGTLAYRRFRMPRG